MSSFLKVDQMGLVDFDLILAVYSLILASEILPVLFRLYRLRSWAEAQALLKVQNLFLEIGFVLLSWETYCFSRRRLGVMLVSSKPSLSTHCWQRMLLRGSTQTLEYVTRPRQFLIEPVGELLPEKESDFWSEKAESHPHIWGCSSYSQLLGGLFTCSLHITCVEDIVIQFYHQRFKPMTKLITSARKVKYGQKNTAVS